jgi:hypothetical protein
MRKTSQTPPNIITKIKWKEGTEQKVFLSKQE